MSPPELLFETMKVLMLYSINKEERKKKMKIEYLKRSQSGKFRLSKYCPICKEKWKFKNFICVCNCFDFLLFSNSLSRIEESQAKAQSLKCQTISIKFFINSLEMRELSICCFWEYEFVRSKAKPRRFKVSILEIVFIKIDRHEM